MLPFEIAHLLFAILYNTIARFVRLLMNCNTLINMLGDTKSLVYAQVLAEIRNTSNIHTKALLKFIQRECKIY